MITRTAKRADRDAPLVNGVCALSPLAVVAPVDTRNAQIVMVNFPAYCVPALSSYNLTWSQ